MEDERPRREIRFEQSPPLDKGSWWRRPEYRSYSKEGPSYLNNGPKRLMPGNRVVPPLSRIRGVDFDRMMSRGRSGSPVPNRVSGPWESKKGLAPKYKVRRVGTLGVAGALAGGAGYLLRQMMNKQQPK